jgi:hypothetical protein
VAPAQLPAGGGVGRLAGRPVLLFAQVAKDAGRMTAPEFAPLSPALPRFRGVSAWAGAHRRSLLDGERARCRPWAAHTGAVSSNDYRAALASPSRALPAAPDGPPGARWRSARPSRRRARTHGPGGSKGHEAMGRAERAAGAGTASARLPAIALGHAWARPSPDCPARC